MISAKTRVRYMVSDSSKRGDPIPGVVIRGRYGHRRSFAAKRWIMDLLISKLTTYHLQLLGQLGGILGGGLMSLALASIRR